MTKRALKRMSRETAFDAAQFEEDAKVRRLPLARGTYNPHDETLAALHSINQAGEGLLMLGAAVEE